MGTQIRLILATICLTVLIWVYADLASQENRDIKLRIELSVPPQSDAVVHIRGAAPEKPGIKDVSIKLGGPKAAIARLDDEERSQGLLLKLPVQIEGAKTREISLRNAVHDWAISRGLHLISLDLDVLWYTVDQYVEIELTVEADAGIFVSEMRGPPRVQPAKVKARLLASQRDERAPAERRLVLPIEERLRSHSGDTFEESLVRHKWHGLDVTYTPEQVTITVARRQGVETYRLTAIPLHEMWPSYRPEGDYRIEWADEDDQVQHIEVVVPAGKPRTLTNKDVIAFVTIDREDLIPQADSQGTTTAPATVSREGILREVHFVFPPDFEDVRVVPPLPKVRFKVVRVPPSAAGEMPPK